MPLKILSPAKVNFGLFILGKLNNNYHEILTVFHKIPFYDEIEISESKKLEIEFIMNNRSFYFENNTIFRAINEISKATGKIFNLKIRVYKKIPIGGGLGGGSSNAGAILKFLNSFYKLSLSSKDLSEIASKVGSDVPFFVINSNSAIGRGRGDVLEPFESKLCCYIYLFFYKKSFITAQMYSKIQNYDNKNVAENKIKNIKLALETNNINLLRENVYNSFESILDKDALDFKEKIQNLGFELVSLSGSGSTFFALNTSLKISSLWIEENL
ncbi:MAG: 4-(cytidine 5'-diphospho)-2-C-methyl-D-erythritol kinase [candidate division WOR-3 bacterium]